jgi:hypothetical protein
LNKADRVTRYQPGGSSGYDPNSGLDPLSDATVCLRDAILMQRLGVNTIRVYNLDPSLDHTACASIFNAAGIYMVLDVNSPLPNESLNRVAPWENYNVDYITRVFGVVEAFKNFNNTLGFFSANEIINEDSVAQAPEYVRAVTRDIKDYIAKHASRTIPVGYSAADVRPLLQDTYNYFACNLANETSSKIDFFGLNSYSWCGGASFTSAGYDILLNDFSNTTIPIFFSEYGCNQVLPRTFTEVGAIYSEPFTGVFSGGMVYEFTEEPNNYGLVTTNSNGTVQLRTDYVNLQSQYNKIDLAKLTAANSTATGRTAPSCSTITITSNITNSFEVPARPDGFDTLIQNGINGTFPSGTTAVTTRTEPDTVYDVNGNQITGLQLNILANDQSNLPGNNTSGTSAGGSSTTTSSGSGATHTNAAVRSNNVDVRFIAGGAIALGLVAQF